MFLHGVSIDFVNLRGDDYTEGNQGDMKIGSPEEDAYRRDLTFNSLFYNINENKIEDCTGKGIEDLENKICRTPLDPLQTFLDDPLRVLRTIRFANRFESTIINDIMAAAQNQDVRVRYSFTFIIIVGSIIEIKY